MADIQPTIILGNRRSGTTLLRLMLTSHSEICIPPEGGFIYVLGWQYAHLREISKTELPTFLEGLYSLDNTQDWKLDYEKLTAFLETILPCSYPRVIHGIYEFYILENCPGKTRWGDKTTGYLEHLFELPEYFPNARFIHIVRDIRAIVASYRRVPHLSDSVDQVVMEWLRGESKIRQLSLIIDRSQYKLVRYKDLIEDPRSNLDSICKFLEVSFEESMLEYWLNNRLNELEPSRHLGWKKLTLEKVTNERLFAWKHELNAMEQNRVRILAGRDLVRYDFEDESENSPPYFFMIKYFIYCLMRDFRKTLRVWKHGFRNNV